MRKYYLSEPAKGDLLAIFLYTLEIWGEVQVPIYQNLVETAMQRIADNPQVPGSKARDDVMPGCRTFRCGKHIIIYRAQPDHIYIARVLHESMDLDMQVDEQDFD